METRETPGASQRLRRALGRRGAYFQQTFRTPAQQQLPRFSAAVVSAHSPIETATVTLEQIVFTPKHLDELLAARHLPVTCGRDWTITAAGYEEVASLLMAAWSDVIDFYFIPKPKHFHLFADHDDYTTIFGATKGQVAKVATALANAGFSRVDGYELHW
jgi:hypothetical protein